MADRLEVYDCTALAHTDKTAPLIVALRFDPGYLTKVEVVIPDGVAGLAGFHFRYAGQQLIPNTLGSWIVGNDEKWSDEPAFSMIGQQWQFVAYNADAYDHTFHVRCYITEIGAPVGSIAGPTIVAPLQITPDTGFADASTTFPQLDLSTLSSGGDSGAGVTAEAPPALDTTLGAEAPPPDVGDVAPAPELDTTLGDAPVVSDE